MWIEKEDDRGGERFVDIFFDIRIQLHAGNLFDDQSQKHVVDIGVNGFASRLILQRRFQNHFLCRGFFHRIQIVDAVDNSIVFVIRIVMILRIGWEAGLVFQNILKGHRILAQDCRTGFVLKLREVALDRIGNVNLPFADQHLQRIVGRVHFGIGG